MNDTRSGRKLREPVDLSTPSTIGHLVVMLSMFNTIRRSVTDTIIFVATENNQASLSSRRLVHGIVVGICSSFRIPMPVIEINNSFQCSS